MIGFITFCIALIKMSIVYVGVGCLCGGGYIFSKERITKKNRKDMLLLGLVIILLGLGILLPFAIF